MPITRDAHRVSAWVSAQQGVPFVMPGVDAIGYEIGGHLMAGLIWYPREPGSVWAHIAATVPSSQFMRAAAEAIFQDAEEVHFEVPNGNALIERMARVLGAVEVPEAARRSDLDRQFFVRRNTGIHARLLAYHPGVNHMDITTPDKSIRKGAKLVRAEGKTTPRGTPLPVGTLVYASGMYELPETVGVTPAQSDVRLLTTDALFAIWAPPTNRAEFDHIPSY